MLRASRAWPLGYFIVLFLAGGCAPVEFGPAIRYHAQKAAVTDAAARHTSASPYYRFNTALLSDLDDALGQPNETALRQSADAVLRKSHALGRAATANEIERMPAPGREELAALARVGPAPAALQQHFCELADAALERDLQDVDRLAPLELRKKLKRIRRSIESLPDDRGRAGRRIMLLWAAIPTAIGIEREEIRLPEKCVAKATRQFGRVAIWRPIESDDAPLSDRYAPVIAVEWPDTRGYNADDDRIGAVRLSMAKGHVEVRIDPAAPTVYTYASEAKINGRVYRQLNYVWWYPERPEMSEDDPVAGHIDGAMLRVTLDAEEAPMIIESSLNCGCAHEVFVSSALEAAAFKAFGSPLEGKRFAIEQDVRGKHDVVVIDTFDPKRSPIRPLVLSSAGYHEVCQIKFLAPESVDSLEVVEDASYRMRSYDALDRLPLAGGIASMFGPDGLVHNAGRPEGYLLAPSGILSAGQPRKRGTQRIRWDDYLHDDPHLLEKTLRIPSHD